GAAGTIWDPNGGAFQTSVNGAKPVGWIGNVRHDPLNGHIESTSNITVFIETTPIGAATYARTTYSTNDGATWNSADMSRAAPVTFGTSTSASSRPAPRCSTAATRRSAAARLPTTTRACTTGPTSNRSVR